ncbi:hypothetical protein SAVC_05645 [Staphylococcus aureus subsp. aureus VC40]|nr:hypothetical protein SAVC_05645 [Staphylococcus aureus subsp. aureus VC40]
MIKILITTNVSKKLLNHKKQVQEKRRKDAVLVNELLVTSDRDFFEQLDQYKKDTVFHKQELQEVKDELQKANKQLQSGIEHMRSTKPFDYENERTGLFSGREETGRKILTADEFERLQETISSAERIVDDYENIKSTDYYTENQELKKRRESLKEVVNTWKEGYHEKSKEVNKLKRENDSLNEQLNVSEKFQASTVTLYRAARANFPGFEKGFNRLKEKFFNDSKFERVGQFMDVVQDNVQKVDRKREKQRTDDLEM